jgi:hypothetical protein
VTVIYASNVSNTTLTSACTMAANSGGSEVAVQTTVTGTNQYVEVVSQAATLASVTTIGSPSGKGWVYLPGAGTFAAGNWSATVTLSASSPGTTDVTIRFYKYSAGTYTSIGSINKTGISGTKTAYSFTATAMPSTAFSASDLLYIDLWWHDTSGAGDNPNVYVSNSSTAGVANDLQVTTSTFTAGITRIQGNSVNSSGTGTSQSITLGSGILQGNLVVAAVACGSNNTTITGPSGWTQATINQPAGASATIETSIWYMVVPSGHAGETSWTWTFSASHSMYICIEEWSVNNGWQTSPVDKTANGDTSGSPTTSTTIQSGTTATTTQASELWIASLAYKNSAQTESSVTAGWTSDLEATLAANNTMTMLYRVVSSTGAASCQYTIGTAQFWAGCVATFMPVSVTTSSRTIPTSVALLATSTRTVTTTAALQSTNSRTVSSTAALLKTSTRTVPTSAALANTFSRIVPTSAALSQPVSRTVPTSAALKGTVNRTIPSAAALQSTNTHTVPTSAALLKTSTRTVPTSATLANTVSRIVPTSASLLSTHSRTVPTTTALTVTRSRTIPTTVSLTESAIFYASNVAQTQGGLTLSAQLASTSGGTETSYSVIMPSSGTNTYVELLAQTGTSQAFQSLPAPTGKGWSISLAGNTILAGSWYSAFTLAKSGTTKTGASLIVRYYRRTMDGTYYLIGVSTLSSQTFSTTKTVYTTPTASATYPWQFVNGDVLYMDAFVLNGATAWASDAFTVYVSNSATQGVYNDGVIVAPMMITTPAELSCLIGAESFQVPDSGLPVLNQSFTLADALDQRSILTLTGEDEDGTLSYQRGQPVMLSDHDQGLLYSGYVNSDKVSKIAAGILPAQTEHQLTFMDPHYLADKRANTTNYLNWTSGDMVCDFIQSTLSQEGVTGTFALESDYTPTTFAQGTLSGTVATTTTTPFTYAPNTASPPITSNTGDLELTRAGTQFTLTESVTSDFSSGTLTNMVASSNSLSPTTVSALKLVATLPFAGAGNTIGTPATGGPTGTGGSIEAIANSIYAQIWSGSMTVGSNDTFNYDIWISSTSPTYMAGVDLLFSDGTYLSSYNGSRNANASVWDQNGLTPDMLTDLTTYAQNCWYTRNISLNTFISGPAGANLAGKTITSVLLFIAGGTAGQYSVYVKNCYLSSHSGTPFFSTSATSPQVNPPVITNNGGYIAARTSVVNAWIATASSRMSPAHSISGVGLVQSSNITWTASLPVSGTEATPYPPGFAPSSSNAGSTVAPASLIFASYDGSTWLPCTNSAPLPGLPAGTKVSTLSLYLLEQFQAGSDPTAIPELLQVNITIDSAANQTTSDITAAYGNTTAWNSGTESGVVPNGNGDLALLTNATYSWTSSTGTTSYTQNATVAVSSGTVTVSTTANNGAGGARFDFAGTPVNFTATFAMELSHVASSDASFTNVCFLYRASSFDNIEDSAFVYPNGYIVQIAFSDSGATGVLALISRTAGNTTVIVQASQTFSVGTAYNIKVIAAGNVHAVYVNNVVKLATYDSAITTAGNFGFAVDGPSTTTSTGVFSNFTATTSFTQGTWTSPAINLNSLGTCGYTQVAWSEVNAAGAAQSTAIVLATTNGGTTWQQCSNGAEVPGLTPGTSVSGVSLQLQMVLFATSAITSPTIPGLYVRVCGNYGTVTGTRISPALSLTPVGYVASSNVMWNANIPTSTTLTVQTTQDLSAYHTVGNNGAGEALPYWTNQPDATQDLFNTNTFANYTNTCKSGGSVASVTQDTAFSNLVLVGGSSALYLNNSISTSDVELLCDMDESDSGGLVWRKMDANNYYELAVHDALSTSGFVNQLRLYKVASGTRSLLGSASSITFTRGTFHRVRVKMQGGLINVYWDGQCKQSYLDTSPLGAGACGLRNNGGISSYYQLWIQPLGTNLSGQVLYTKVTMTTSDPSVMPQLFTLVACVRGTSIGTGATINQLHPVTTPFAAYYSSEMDTLVQSSGDYYWYIDKWKKMHFGPRLARPGAFPIQSVEDPAGNYSGYLLYQPQVTVLSSADLFRSQQIVTNVTGLVTPPAEIKVADGSTTSWTLGYPVYSAPTITINGQGATIGVQGIDNNRQFYWQPGSASISYDSTLPKLPSGTILSITYVGQSTVNVALNNSATQTAQAAMELNSGIVAEIESAMQGSTNGMTTAQATTFGNGLLARYGNNGTIEMVGTTMYPGLTTGTTIPLFLEQIMGTWNVQLPLVKVTTTAYQGANGMIYLYSADCTNGANLNNWSRVFYAQ